MRLLAAVLSLIAVAGSAHGTPAPADSSANLRRLFPNPPAEYRTMPFFVWNGDVNEADIDKNLREYKAQGVGGVFIHARVGLITPYLSDRWFDMFRYTVKKAKELGLQVWIYDEDPFPSGSAGGMVAAEMPESVSQGQGLTMRKLTAATGADCPRCKVLLRKPGDAFVAAESCDAEAAGEYYCFETAGAGDRAYPDLILPGVTERFRQITMNGYERIGGSEFGRTIPGIFTDEPNIAPPGGSIRWTPDFFDQFAGRRGYDVRPQLASMFEEDGDWRKVRHDYNLTLLELFIERWSKPWNAYTEKTGLKWTGHYWEHGWPGVTDGPDNMAMYPYHQQPGIDVLFNQFNEEKGEQFGNVRIVKEVSSVANQFGRKRTLSETYGGSGWELRFEDMKRNGDWEYVLGINFMNQHLSYQTLAGVRKYDWPPSFGYQDSWWKHFHVLADYFARLSVALSAGEQVNRIVVLEPTTTAWMYARPGKEIDSRLAGVQAAFRPFLNRLEELQAEYDIGCESIIKDRGGVGERQLVIGNRSYELVVLAPGTENLERSTVDLFERYLKAGGTVLSFVEGPVRVDGSESGRLRDLAAQYPSQWLMSGSIDDAAARERLAGVGFRDTSGKLHHQRRILEDGELLFFVNSSLETPAGATVVVDGRSLVRFDALTGKTAPYPARPERGKLVFTVELPPAGSLLLVASRTGIIAAPPPASTRERPVPALGPTAIKRETQNVLRVDYCDLKLNDSVQMDLPVHLALDKAFRQYGFRGDPWSGRQFRSEFLDKDHFPPDSGFDAIFHFDVGDIAVARGMQAVVERPRYWRVSVNNVGVRPRPGAWWIDTSFGVYEIGGLVHPGDNTLIIKAQPMSVHAEIQPVYVLGDFGVEAQTRGFRVVPAREIVVGSWKDQLLPFYSDAVVYRQSFRIGPGAATRVVRLGRWQGVVSDVRVNGRSAGVIGWTPYELDVTEYLHPGKNEIEVAVYGSLKNLFGPHHARYSPGLVGSWLWRTAPEHTPSGNRYDLSSYGLFEDFQLVERKLIRK